MKIFSRRKELKNMDEFDDVETPEFVGRHQRFENADRAKDIVNYVEEIRKCVDGAASITRSVDCRYYPDSSSYLTFPNYTHIKDQEINRKLSSLFALSDYVTVNSKPDGSVQFTFIVLNVWEA